MDISERAGRVDVLRQLCYLIPMLSKIVMPLAMVIALSMAPVYVSARTCIVFDSPGQQACKPGCCANKTCCATSKKNSTPVSQPLAKGNSTFEFNATCVAALNALSPDYTSLDRHLSFARTSSCAFASPQLAALCTFLI